MRFISFFAGIGGFDLGLERAGHECVGQVEIDPYALCVLERHWPDVPRFGDIRTLDPAALPEAELWCGGFPCQPFSVAGARKGAEDERHLWPAWARLIAGRRPEWLFLENVPGLLTIDGGRTFGGILADLAALGYVGEWTVLGARDVGAPHRRDRLWIVAHLADAECSERRPNDVSGGRSGQGRDGQGQAPSGTGERGQVLADPNERGLEECGQRDGIAATRLEAPRRHDADGRDQDVADAALQRRDGSGGARGWWAESTNGRSECWCGRGEPWCCDPADVGDAERCGPSRQGQPCEPFGTAAGGDREADRIVDGSGRPTQPAVGVLVDGLPAGLVLARVARGVPKRVDQLRCLGNAVVPQVVEAIARRVWG